MITHDWLAKRPALFKNFTGLEVSEFDSFYAKAVANYDEYEKKRLEKTQKEKKTRNISLYCLSSTTISPF